MNQMLRTARYGDLAAGERHRVLRNTYALLALSLIPTVAGAWVGIAVIYFLAAKIRTFGQYTVGDILEARAAGVRSVAVTWGWHDRERLVAVSPDFIVDTPERLLSLASAVGSER